MKIISWNVNGIRAVEKKGELQTLLAQNPDLLFIQETKAKQEQLSDYLTANPEYYQFYHSAEKPGYSSVAIWAKKKSFKTEPNVIRGMDGWNDAEGRVIRIDFKSYSVFGIYFPNGGKSEEAWQEKLEFYDHFLQLANDLRSSKRKVIFCGDLNVAHNEIDLARPKENEGKVGFRREERDWVDRLVEQNWVDVFRTIHPHEASYTWWNMKTRARERDVGWRIDYFFADKPLFAKIKSISHLHSQMGSDHCPVILDIDI